MKTRLLSIIVALALVLSLVGVVAAAPEVVSSFTITPSSVYPGDSVTMSIDFTVAPGDLAVENTLCLYFVDADYSTPLNGIGNLTSALSDTYAQSATTGFGRSERNLPGCGGSICNQMDHCRSH